MTLAALVVLILKASIAVLVFTVGLGTRPRELTCLLRRPGRLVRALLSMNVVMLALAVAIVLAIPLHEAVRVTLVALALSPVPPLLPKKLVKAGGGHDYVMALLFSASVIAVLWIPLAGALLDRIVPADISIPAPAVAKLVFMTVLGPTLAGVIVRLLAPGLAERVAGPLAKAATLLLLAGLVLMLVKAAPAMAALVGDGTLAALVIFVVLGLVAGHLLGGPSPGERSVLALATASRHPGVALAIAQLTFPAEKAVPAVLLLYLLTAAVLTLPYVAWRRKALAGEAES
ncbi:Na+-dependent transporter [Caulobacter sp. 17J65-9]|uniref:Na+-dependent transporter n=1 Tax=Caulobacter sp. 17J65-9 TaxID=2709382 RepID=UPI0013C5E633|nr:Na+-dependent transporter [Caulobacter sp. 17J65-9]NEX92895.1 Na+-dependent transporter [Caulobacter sp. 17J65-9]